MKKAVLTGFISELALSVCALTCLIVAAVFGQAALIVASALVMLALLYIAGGFYVEHVKPENTYFDWAVWFWNIFCVEWTWNIFCKQWTWNIFCVEWTWNIFCKQWEGYSQGGTDMKLFPHQEEALKRTKGFDRVAYYHDMGLGKTFTGSEKMKQYDNRVNLIVCQKSKVNDWVNHFNEHYPKAAVFNLTKPKELQCFMLWSLAEPPAKASGIVTVGIINYELVWRRPKLLDLTDFTLMLDESSLIQNKTAKQTRFVLRLNPKNVILLSGTPTSGKYENLHTQAQLLGWNISEDLYNRQYINWKTVESDGFFHKVVDMDNPYINVERLKQKFRNHGSDFVKTEEVFDLPEQIFTTVTVPTSKEYRKFMRDSIVKLNDGTELIGDQVFTKRLYARQLCSMYSADKLEAFKELIQSTNDRVIVFYNFTKELEQLNQIALDLERPTSCINGQEKDLYCYEHYDNSVTFIQYRAGSKGLNLQLANKIIYYSPTEMVDDWMQSQKRIHRIGQQRTCFYYQMMCENSIERWIYEALARGVDYTDDLFNVGSL